MPKAKDGVPATRPTNATIYSERTVNRFRALFDDVVENMLLGDKPRKDAQGRTVREVIADQVLADPQGTLRWLEERLLKRGESAGAGGAVNIGALYVQAVQAAQPRRLDVVDVTAEPEQPEDW